MAAIYKHSPDPCLVAHWRLKGNHAVSACEQPSATQSDWDSQQKVKTHTNVWGFSTNQHTSSLLLHALSEDDKTRLHLHKILLK